MYYIYIYIIYKIYKIFRYFNHKYYLQINEELFTKF